MVHDTRRARGRGRGKKHGPFEENTNAAAAGGRLQKRRQEDQEVCGT